MRLFATLVISALLLVSISGCGKKEEQPKIDTAKFETAITGYLKDKSMGMKVASFEKMDVKDDQATAVCKMQEAEGLYNMNVTWKFTFKKEKDSWKVTTHTDKP